MEPSRLSLPEKRSEPASANSRNIKVHRGYSLSPPVQKNSPVIGDSHQLNGDKLRTPENRYSTINSHTVQRNAEDQPIVNFISAEAEKAERAYDLLQDQSETTVAQIDLLEELISGDELNKHPDLFQTGNEIHQAAKTIRTHLEESSSEIQDDYLTIKARGEQASIHLPSELLNQWASECVAQTGRISLELAKITSSIVWMRDKSIEVAKMALKVKEPEVMKRILVVSDRLDESLQEGDRVIGELNEIDTGASSKKEIASFITAATDSLNNATTGLAFGIVSAVDAGTAFQLSATVGSNMGIAGGALGIFFGAIGTFLGIKNTILGSTKRSRLKKEKPNISNENMDKVIDYAIHQKGKKIGRNIAGTTAGLFAITAGIIGLVAAIAGTMGIAAIVLGILAGVIGLGFVVFKFFRSRYKLYKERKELAKDLIQKIQSNGDGADSAREIVRQVKLDPDNVNQKDFDKKLTKKIGSHIKSNRTKMAESLVRALIDGKPSEKFDAEIILDALGLDPKSIRSKVNHNNVGEAVGKVAGKMASW